MKRVKSIKSNNNRSSSNLISNRTRQYQKYVNDQARKRNNAVDDYQRPTKSFGSGVSSRVKSRVNHGNESTNRISKALAPILNNPSQYSSRRGNQRSETGKIRGVKKQKYANRNRDIYEESSIDENYSGPKKVTRFDRNDISSMSVDDIINSAAMRRELQRRNTNQTTVRNDSPPTNDLGNYENGYSPQIYFRDDSTIQDYEAEPEPQTAPTPQAPSNEIIEQKVEEVLKRFMETSKIGSMQGSRESSLGRSMTAPEYWNMNQQYPVQSQFHNSFGSVQPMFHTTQDTSHQNNFTQLK